jgi:hypothetical protein
VFVAGEMLDWEAPTGGYLLQACFATGVAAARAVVERLALSGSRASSRPDLHRHRLDIGRIADLVLVELDEHQRLAGHARDDVDVQVRHALADAVVLDDREALDAQAVDLGLADLGGHGHDPRQVLAGAISRMLRALEVLEITSTWPISAGAWSMKASTWSSS